MTLPLRKPKEKTRQDPGALRHAAGRRSPHQPAAHLADEVEAEGPILATLMPVVVARQSRVLRAVKRLVDVLLAVVGLVVVAPLLAAVAVLISLDSRGRVFFRQPRQGWGQRPFTVVKLRTMDDAGAVTRVGRFLRPTGIDELPQLWNVLAGDMSVVGPRPEVLDRVPRWEAEFPDYWARHLVRPGITGWAQVNGLRGQVSIGRRLEHDLHYIRSWSLWLDARILVRTLSTVWRDTRQALRR